MRPDSASGGDNDSRQVEARKILFEMGLKDASFEQDKEADFVSELCDRFDEYGPQTFVSSKQLFWLRDLKETRHEGRVHPTDTGLRNSWDVQSLTG